jgi:hypothetical protein
MGDIFRNIVIELGTFVKIFTLIKLMYEIYGRYKPVCVHKLIWNDLTQRHALCLLRSSLVSDGAIRMMQKICGETDIG